MKPPLPFRTIEQSRIKPIIGIPISVLFAGIGVWMVRDPDGSTRYSPAVVTLMGIAVLATAGWFAFRIVSVLLKPLRLHLSREGFRVENGDGRGLIGWSDITPFQLVRIRGVRAVRYQILSDGPILPVLSDRFLPGNLDISALDLFDVMETNRHLYAGSGTGIGL